jgi:predicted Rossmann fold nucleotide-binding protein DprA/Smf involved in DNA uptake
VADDAQRLTASEPHFPHARLKLLGMQAPAAIAARGNLDILASHTVALFCSVSCPGNLVIQTYELASALQHAGATVIGGFHSPMEQECLTVLLRGSQPVVICPARSIEEFRLPPAWRKPLAEQRLLLLSPFDARLRRATTALAEARNRFVAALADEVFIAHAAAGGKTLAFARELMEWEKPVLTLEDERNGPLLRLGAYPLRPESWATEWDTLARAERSAPDLWSTL